MADLVATAQALLAALRSLGRDGEAAKHEASFEHQNWEINQADLRALSQTLNQAFTTDSKEAPSNVTPPIYPVLPGAHAIVDSELQPPSLLVMDVCPQAAEDSEEGSSNLNFQPPGTEPQKSSVCIPGIPLCLRHFESFITPIKDYGVMLNALTALGKVTNFEACLSAIKEIFLTILGFDSKDVDATDRLGNQRTFSRLQAVADYEGFVISVAEMTTEVPYANTYQSIFRLYPYGLCVVVNPTRHIVRFAYSHGRERQSRALSYRTLVGSYRGRSITDNLIVWIKRLELLRPQFGDDQSKLRDRIETALGCTPSDLARRWPSSPLPLESQIPGPDWQSLPFVEAESFLQLGMNERVHWGLEAVLHDCFPLGVAKGAKQLHYLGYRVISPPSKEDGGASLVLKVALQSVGTSPSTDTVPKEQFEITCFIPTPNVDGCFKLGGGHGVFEPVLRAHGALASQILDEGTEDLFDDYNDAFLLDMEQEYLDVASEVADVESEEDIDESPARDLEGGSLNNLLELAVSRKLIALGKRLWRIPANQFNGVQSVYGVLSAFSDSNGRFELYSKPFLLAALSPVSPSSREKRFRKIAAEISASPVLPPAWACLDSSAQTAPRAWYPVASARLHPSGELSVPMRSDSSYVLGVATGDAFSLNERLGQVEATSPPSWWIASHLADWCALNVGDIEHVDLTFRDGFFYAPQHILRVAAKFPYTYSKMSCPICLNRADEQKISCLCTRQSDDHFEHPVLAVHPSLLNRLALSNPTRRTLTIEVPAQAGVLPPVVKPTLIGKKITAGIPWLHLAAQTWTGTGTPKWPRAIETLAKLGDLKLETAGFVYRIPNGWRGVVSSASVEPIYNTYGVVVRWRASLEVVSAPIYERALLPDGRCVRLCRLFPEDAPYNPYTGESADLVLYDATLSSSASDNNTSSLGFSGLTGECVEFDRLYGVIGWIPSYSDESPRQQFTYRLIDNAPMPEPDGVALTEGQRLWLRLAYGEQAALLDYADTRGAGRHAPWEPALGSIIVDLGLHGAKAFVAAEAIVSGPTCADESEDAVTDPLRTRVDQHRVDGRGNLGGFVWQCQCGVLSGADFAGERCIQCQTDVTESVAGANRWICECGDTVRTRNTRIKCEFCCKAVRNQATSRRELLRVELSLPTAVVHPWRFDEAAGLLGLTRKEFQELIASHGPTPVLQIAEAALREAPTAAVQERMAREDNSATLRELGKCLFKLQNWYDEGAEQLSLSAVPVVPTRFLMCGLVPGAPTLVHGGLLEQYRALRLAIQQAEQLERSTMPALRTSVGIALQEAVQLLYGDCERTSNRIDSFADLVGRIWPISRSSGLTTVVPGLCTRDGVLAFYPKSAGDGGENKESVEVTSGEDVTHAVSLVLPRLPTLPISSPDYWMVRYAQIQLTERLLAPIAGLFAELSFTRLDSASRERLMLLGVEDTDELSMIAAREVLRSLDRDGSRPDQLLLLFECKLPVRLSSDPERARANLMERLERALPSSDVGSTIAREVLAYILGGWWKATPTPTNPLGWRRESPEKQLDSPWTRAVPPLRSSAWALWQGMGAFSNPVRWLLGREPRTAFLSNTVGKHEFLPRQRWWDEREEGDAKQLEVVRESIGKEATTASLEQVTVPSVLEDDVNEGGAMKNPQVIKSDKEIAGNVCLAASAESDPSDPTTETFARVLRGNIETWLNRMSGQETVRRPLHKKFLNLDAKKLEGGTE